MNYVKINGVLFDARVAIMEYKETFNVLDGENAGRVKSGRMIRDVLGTAFGHNVTFMNNGNNDAFDELWNFLKVHSVDDSVMLEAVDGQEQIMYEAYYTSGERSLRYVDKANNVNYWDAITVNFIPIDLQLKP